MAASKKNAKGSKTAHVLNLLTAPGTPKEGAPAAGEPAAEGTETAAAPSRPLLPPILEVAQANDDNLSQQIQQALEEELADSAAPVPPPQPILEEVPPMAVEQPVAEQTPQRRVLFRAKMSQEDIEKMLAAANAPAQEPEPAPEPAPAAPSGGKMSQEDIEKMLAAANAPAQEPAPAPEPAPAAPSGGKMSQEDIEKMLATANAPAQEPAPEPEPAPAAPSGGKMSQEDIEKMLAAANAPAQEPAPEPEPAPAPEPTPAPAASKPTPPPPASAEDEDISYINIMQVLVEEKAPAYIKKFGLCTCKQCEADVKALTLTNLVPKYVVLSRLDRIPMLTVYEGRFNSTVFAQLTRACKVVMDHPHHHR